MTRLLCWLVGHTAPKVIESYRSAIVFHTYRREHRGGPVVFDFPLRHVRGKFKCRACGVVYLGNERLTE
jgi:hypothetical protein